MQTSYFRSEMAPFTRRLSEGAGRDIVGTRPSLNARYEVSCQGRRHIATQLYKFGHSSLAEIVSTKGNLDMTVTETLSSLVNNLVHLVHTWL